MDTKTPTDIITRSTISSIASTLLLQPLDVLRTRIQQPSKSIGISKNLWAGLNPTLIRNVCGCTIYFSIYEKSKSVCPNSNFQQNLLIGATCRSVACVLMFPFTLVKTQMESTLFHYKSIPDAFKALFTKGGFRSLYKGLLSTLIRDVPFSSLYLGIYLSLDNLVLSKSIPALFLNGVIATSIASFLTQPAEMVKTRVQLSESKTSVLRSLIKKEGYLILWRGLPLRILHKVLSTALMWTIYRSI